MKPLIPKRSKSTHKGEVGSLLLVTGSKGKMGASILCARAAMKAGIGLLTIHAPRCGTTILQIAVPEAMVSEDLEENEISNIMAYNSVIGIGAGMGIHEKTISALENLLNKCGKPVVLDADAINILSINRSLMSKLPRQSILTPHPGELKRLVGDWTNDFEKLEKLRTLCINYKLNIVLKGVYSAVCNYKGEIYFNPTGNPGMATAGSGDVLTGIVSSFLAQRLEPFNALRLGVYIHGLAGDLAMKEIGENGLIASDIVGKIPNAMH